MGARIKDRSQLNKLYLGIGFNGRVKNCHCNSQFGGSTCNIEAAVG